LPLPLFPPTELRRPDIFELSLKIKASGQTPGFHFGRLFQVGSDRLQFSQSNLKGSSLLRCLKLADELSDAKKVSPRDLDEPPGRSKLTSAWPALCPTLCA